MKYTVSTRGAIPPDVTRKISEAHALAIQRKPTNAVRAPAGKGSTPDATGQSHQS